MKITTEPKSDQLNASELIGSTRTVTIAEIREGTAEQKYDIALEGESRVWRPPLTVLRVLKGCWGDYSGDWIGKRVTLYCDERVRFGKEEVGGIRVSHASGIDKPTTVSVPASRGKPQKITVQPLPDAPQPAQEPRITEETWAAITEHAQQQGIEQVGQWATQQLGRALNGPQDITADEGDQLMRLLTTGEEDA